MTNLAMTSEARMFSSLDVDANKGRGHVENHAAAQFRCIESATKQRPILFNGAMVRALLDGSKTQTRRIVKPQFASDAAPAEMCAETAEGWQTTGHSGLWWCEAGGCADDAIRCPYGRPGDRLWVREAFHDNSGIHEPGVNQRIYYRADYANGAYNTVLRWKSSIHMPRWASRITLEITGVRVERLQDISEADAKAEGITPREVRQMWLYGASAEERAAMYRRAAVDPYRELWESINGAGSWAANPWVWVVEFKRVQNPCLMARRPQDAFSCPRPAAAA